MIFDLLGAVSFVVDKLDFLEVPGFRTAKQDWWCNMLHTHINEACALIRAAYPKITSMDTDDLNAVAFPANEF